MGNQVVRQPNQQLNWVLKGTNDFRIPGSPKIVYNTVTGMYADQYYIQFSNTKDFRKQCQIYRLRSGILLTHLVEVVGMMEHQKDYHTCSGKDYSAIVMVERIPWRLFLQPLHSLSLIEGLYILDGVLNGVEELCQGFDRSFLIYPQMIGINTHGCVKVWHNVNFAVNYPDDTIKVTSVKPMISVILDIIDEYVISSQFQEFAGRIQKIGALSFMKVKCELQKYLIEKNISFDLNIGIKIISRGYKQYRPSKRQSMYKPYSPKKQTNHQHKIKINHPKIKQFIHANKLLQKPSDNRSVSRQNTPNSGVSLTPTHLNRVNHISTPPPYHLPNNDPNIGNNNTTLIKSTHNDTQQNKVGHYRTKSQNVSNHQSNYYHEPQSILVRNQSVNIKIVPQMIKIREKVNANIYEGNKHNSKNSPQKHKVLFTPTNTPKLSYASDHPLPNSISDRNSPLGSFKQSLKFGKPKPKISINQIDYQIINRKNHQKLNQDNKSATPNLNHYHIKSTQSSMSPQKNSKESKNIDNISIKHYVPFNHDIKKKISKLASQQPLMANIQKKHTIQYQQKQQQRILQPNNREKSNHKKSVKYFTKGQGSWRPFKDKKILKKQENKNQNHNIQNLRKIHQLHYLNELHTLHEEQNSLDLSIEEQSKINNNILEEYDCDGYPTLGKIAGEDQQSKHLICNDHLYEERINKPKNYEESKLNGKFIIIESKQPKFKTNKNRKRRSSKLIYDNEFNYQEEFRKIIFDQKKESTAQTQNVIFQNSHKPYHPR